MLSTRHTALCPSSSSPATGHGLPGICLPCARLPWLGRGGSGTGSGTGDPAPPGVRAAGAGLGLALLGLLSPKGCGQAQEPEDPAVREQSSSTAQAVL